MTNKRQVKRCSWPEMGKAMWKAEYAIEVDSASSPITPRLDTRLSPACSGFEQGPAQFLAQGPKLAPGLWVVGLSVCTSLPHLVEVAARNSFDLLRDGKTSDGLRPFLDCAHRVAEGALDHLGIHQGGRVQRVNGRACVPQVLSQIEGEHYLGKFALRVGFHRVVAVLQHEIREVQGALPRRSDVDDPGRGGVLKEWQEQSREQEVREVVDREGELVAVLALPTLWGDDASVVYEHIKAIVLREDTFRQVARGFERGEVGQVVTQLLVACLFAYSVQGGPKAFHVPAVQQHRSALPRELLRDAPAQAVGGARYEYGRFCRVSHGYSFLSMTSQFAFCTESILGHGPRDAT